MQYPDFEKPFTLMTDGSAKGLGAVLTQLDENKKERVISYASRSLTGTQKNYTATELEMLAVVWAVEHFRPYLEYRHFTLLTDHSALTYMKNNTLKELSGKQARWILRLQPYNFTIKYRPGEKNANADALSRL